MSLEYKSINCPSFDDTERPEEGLYRIWVECSCLYRCHGKLVPDTHGITVTTVSSRSWYKSLTLLLFLFLVISSSSELASWPYQQHANRVLGKSAEEMVSS